MLQLQQQQQVVARQRHPSRDCTSGVTPCQCQCQAIAADQCQVHFSASRPSFDFFLLFSAVSSVSRKWTTTQSIVPATMPWLDQEVAWLIKIIATYGYGYGYESEVSLSYLPIRIPSTAKPEPRTVGEHDRKYAQLFVGHGAGRYKLQTPRTEPNQQANLPLRNKTTQYICDNKAVLIYLLLFPWQQYNKRHAQFVSSIHKLQAAAHRT